jgi:quercetin dioxygenase-like cupin family protein
VSDPSPATPLAVAAEAGDSYWTLGTLVTVKVSGEQTGGRFALWENTLPHGAAPPSHSHPQDESFYVLEGELTVWLDGERGARGPGDFTFAPAGVPHTFRVDSESARVLVLSTPAGIERFLIDLGIPAEAPVLPPPDASRPDEERRKAIERAHGMQVYGPPPGPDD